MISMPDFALPRSALVTGMALLCLAPSWVGATVVMPRPASEVIRDAEFLGVVAITAATLLDAMPTPSKPWCGFSYKAEVLDSLKGPTGSVQFVSIERLHVGERYLLALAQSVVSASFTTRSKEGPSVLEQCAEKHPGLRVIDDTVSAFSAFKWVGPALNQVREDWVEFSALAYTADLNVVSISVDSVTINGFDTTAKVVTERKLAKDYLITKSPLLYLPGKYIRWQDFREYLVREAARAT